MFPANYFWKKALLLDIRQGSKYASAFNHQSIYCSNSQRLSGVFRGYKTGNTLKVRNMLKVTFKASVFLVWNSFDFKFFQNPTDMFWFHDHDSSRKPVKFPALTTTDFRPFTSLGFIPKTYFKSRLITTFAELVVRFWNETILF